MTLAVVFALLAMPSCSSDAADEPPATTSVDVTTPAEAQRALAAEGYVFGLPLVTSVRTLQTFGGLIGVNRPFTQQAVSDASTRVIVAPNTDTLYAIAVLDLRAGPLLLTVPNIPDRYHTFQLLDAWTESFAYLGTRTTDGVAGTWLLTPPGWEGEVPDGVEVLAVPTPRPSCSVGCWSTDPTTWPR